jgi:hypothetical protein
MRYNPFQIFQASQSPAGLYARKKWLGESENAAWQDDFNQTVSSLTRGQAADGSWDQSLLETIRHLFGLHLTVRERTEDIRRALVWLIDMTLTGDLSGPYLEDLSADAFRELPFISAKQPLVFACATLFLASVFQMEKEERVEAHYRLLIGWLDRHADHTEVWAEKSDILRALIVHPLYARDSSTLKLIEDLEKIQKSSGIWPAPVPFFLIVNTLAHLNAESAHRQWIKALPLLLNIQKKDGAWGVEDREWNTFLVVHALHNKKHTVINAQNMR